MIAVARAIRRFSSRHGGGWGTLTGAVALVLAVLGTGVVAVSASTADASTNPGPVKETCGPRWVTAWQAGMQAVSGGSALAGRTLRMVVQPRADGTEVRVRLSNRHGAGPLAVGSMSIAPAGAGAAVVGGNPTPVRFAAQSTVVVPPGAEVYSDPVALNVRRGRPLAVSLFVEGSPEVLSGHPEALQTSYVSEPGDFSATPTTSVFSAEIRSWLVLSGVDVLAPRPVNALVAVGDSITDGVGAGVDSNQRWTDALAERLASAGGAHQMSVLNAGLSRSELLRDEPGTRIGSPLTRFPHEVVAAAGVTDVLLHAGTNDIAAGRGAQEIVEGIIRFAERARAAGLRVFLTTITPAATGRHGTRQAVVVREAVNHWLRTEGPAHADAVFDFAAAVADPVWPTRLAGRYDAGDGLHLSPEGYRALAAAVDLDRLTGSPCLRS